MKPSTKVAVVGVGALGEHHARIYAQLPEAKLVAVVDTKAGRAHEIATRYNCRGFSDYREILDSVEAVSLAVPTCEHRSIGTDFLERGIHVLVEKPLASDLFEADRLIETQQKKGCVLQVGHSERFNPALQAVRSYVTRPQFFESHRLGVFVRRSLDIDVVLDLMIHDLDIILYLNQSPLQDIRAVGIPVLTPKVDIANARLEFENGCVANVTASRVSSEKIRKLRFFQPHDYVSIDFYRQEVEMYSLVETSTGKQIIERHLEIHRDEPLNLEIQAFLGAIRDKQPAGCSGEEAKKALEIALSIVEQVQGSIR